MGAGALALVGGSKGLLVASTVASAGFAAFSGFQQLQASRDQQAAERGREQQFALQGVQRSNQILQDQIDTIAAVNVSAAAGGIDPFSGSPAAVKRRIRERANRQLSTAAADTAFNVEASRSSRRQAGKQGTASLLSGFSRAGGSLLDTATRLREIG